MFGTITVCTEHPARDSDVATVGNEYSIQENQAQLSLKPQIVRSGSDETVAKKSECIL